MKGTSTRLNARPILGQFPTFLKGFSTRGFLVLREIVATKLANYIIDFLIIIVMHCLELDFCTNGIFYWEQIA